MTIKTTGWTAEKRARMAEMTKARKPWEKATGPKTLEGKNAVKHNALRHGFRSAEFEALQKALGTQKRFVETLLHDL